MLQCDEDPDLYFYGAERQRIEAAIAEIPNRNSPRPFGGSISSGWNETTTPDVAGTEGGAGGKSGEGEGEGGKGGDAFGGGEDQRERKERIEALCTPCPSPGCCGYRAGADRSERRCGPSAANWKGLPPWWWPRLRKPLQTVQTFTKPFER